MRWNGRGGRKARGTMFPAGRVYGLSFPSKTDGPTSAFVALQFLNPHSDGLPIWGPSDAGATYIWKFKPRQQDGYYVTFWWSNNGSFLWDGGNSNTYYGAHPYPSSGGASGTAHVWEIGGFGSGADWTDTRAGGTKTVIKDQWYTQALRVIVNGDGTKTGIFYIDLPSVANADVIQADVAASWGETNPPNPALTFGDSPWYADFQHERMSGILGPVKIFNKVLSQADMLSEAADMSALQTSEGQSNIWWGKSSFDGVDDLACDYGAGRAFSWADPNNKATLVEI